jgi:hypothetical protein
MEMRNEIRYRLDAPALFYWESLEQMRLQGEGITRDISVVGAFIVSPICPPVEASLQFEVVLSSLPGVMPVVRIRGEARVVRVDHATGDAGENGFAVVSQNLTRWNLAIMDNESSATGMENLELTGAKPN